MTVKDQVIAAIQQLPDEAEFRDIEEEIALLHAIKKAEQEIVSGAIIGNDEMRSRIAQWTSN